MITFSFAQKILNLNEGGYNDDPDDAGGETYKGIARNFWGKWIGWEIIDKYKQENDFPNVLYKDEALNNLVEEFYQFNFWQKNRVDAINNDLLKLHYYDMCVNSGSFVATKLLQELVYTPNDGIIGVKTIAAVNNYKNQKELCDKYIEARNNFYQKAAKKNKNSKYLEGWLDRINNINREYENRC